MKAYTVWPEWGWATCRLGKDVENRTYGFPKELIGQDVAVHSGLLVAGKGGRDAEWEGFKAVAGMALRAGWVVELLPVAASDPMEMRRISCRMKGKEEMVTAHDLIKGAVVAVARLVGLVEPQQQYKIQPSPWAVTGQFWWLLAQVRPLKEPVRCPGHQWIWTLPPKIERLVKDQVFL